MKNGAKVRVSKNFSGDFLLLLLPTTFLVPRELVTKVLSPLRSYASKELSGTIGNTL